MKNKRFWLAFIVIAVYIVIYEWVFHGGMLKGLYDATASVWRPEETMEAFMPWMMFGQLLFAFAFCCLYSCSTCQGSLKSGACYGAVIGLLMGSVSLIYYAVLPISLELLGAWLVGGMIETVIGGVILSRVYQPA